MSMSNEKNENYNNNIDNMDLNQKLTFIQFGVVIKEKLKIKK